MAKTNNTLHLPVILSQEENNKQVLKAGLQPAYGPHASLDAAKTALEAEFGTIANVPRSYTFCIINASGKPEEWWLTKKGSWESKAKKANNGTNLEDIKIRVNEGGNLEISYNGGEDGTWIPIEGDYDPSTLTEELKKILKFRVKSGALEVSYDGTNYTKIFTLRFSSGQLQAGNGKTWSNISGGNLKTILPGVLQFRTNESANDALEVSYDGGSSWQQFGRSCQCNDETVKYAKVTVEVTPEDAKVLINGEETTTKTIEVGKTVTIKVSKEGYIDQQEVFTMPDEDVTHRFKLDEDTIDDGSGDGEWTYYITIGSLYGATNNSRRVLNSNNEQTVTMYMGSGRYRLIDKNGSDSDEANIEFVPLRPTEIRSRYPSNVQLLSAEEYHPTTGQLAQDIHTKNLSWIIKIKLPAADKAFLGYSKLDNIYPNPTPAEGGANGPLPLATFNFDVIAADEEFNVEKSTAQSVFYPGIWDIYNKVEAFNSWALLPDKDKGGKGTASGFFYGVFTPSGSPSYVKNNRSENAVFSDKLTLAGPDSITAVASFVSPSAMDKSSGLWRRTLNVNVGHEFEYYSGVTGRVVTSSDNGYPAIRVPVLPSRGALDSGISPYIEIPSAEYKMCGVDINGNPLTGDAAIQEIAGSNAYFRFLAGVKKKSTYSSFESIPFTAVIKNPEDETIAKITCYNDGATFTYKTVHEASDGTIKENDSAYSGSDVVIDNYLRVGLTSKRQIQRSDGTGTTIMDVKTAVPEDREYTFIVTFETGCSYSTKFVVKA